MTIFVGVEYLQDLKRRGF